jgi:hypothetical protein
MSKPDSEIIEKFMLAKDLFRRTGILHEIQSKQLQFLAYACLDDSVKKLDSLVLVNDITMPDSPKSVIFKVIRKKSKTKLQVPETLRNYVRFLLGDDFKVVIEEVKNV